jgi:hypothetical protein
MKGGTDMTHKNLPKKPTRYPFERKAQWQRSGPRSLNLPASHPLAGTTLCRMPEWDRSRQVKKYA